MRYTKIITLTGNGISGSVRIEGTGGRTAAAVKIRQPLPQKPILFLLFGERFERTALSDDLTGPADPEAIADAALLAVNDKGALRFIAEGKSLGCKTDLEKVKQDIRMRENSAKRTEPAAEKLSLRAVAGGERKKLAGTVTAPVSGAEGDGDKPLISAIPMPQVMPEEEPAMDEEPASKKALTSVRLPVRRKRSIRDLGERKTPDQETETGSADASLGAPVTEADERPADEGSVIGEENAKANEIPESAETETGGMEDTDTVFELSEELNDTAGAVNAEVSAQGAAGPETEPSGTEEPLKETAPREDNIIKTGPPPEPARSRALSDILDQARELFPSGYDRPAAAQDPAKGDQGDTLKLGERQGRKAADRRTPMQRNTKWESEMEDVMRGAGKKAEQGAPPRPKQDVKPKQSETAADRKADDSVPNPFPETFPNSKWRKVTYPGTNRYYLEGEATGPNGRFQIAALPGEYSAVPPQRAKGFDRFIRAADGCGYWLRLMKR